MLRAYFLSISFLFSLALASFPAAHAASFDCANAKEPDEIAICSSPALSRLDTKMAALWFSYEKIPFLMGVSAERAEEAEAFLERRRACGADEDCLRTAYQERIRMLERGIESWMKDQASADGAARSWSPAVLPEAVRTVAEGYRDECAQLGGTLEEGFDQPLVMTGDLDGDRLQDFVLNPQNMQCSAAATAFCGNGGCDIRLALSIHDYAQPVEILGGAPALKQNEAGTVLDVWVDDTNCAEMKEEGDACLARYYWKDDKLAISYMRRDYAD